MPQEHITKQQWKDSLILGVTLFLGGQGLLTWGAHYLSSGITGLLNSTIPLWVAIIGYLIYKKRKKVGLVRLQQSLDYPLDLVALCYS